MLEGYREDVAATAMVIINITGLVMCAVFGWRFLREVHLNERKIREAMAVAVEREAQQHAAEHALPQVIQAFTPFAQVPEVQVIFARLDERAGAAAGEVRSEMEKLFKGSHSSLFKHRFSLSRRRSGAAGLERAGGAEGVEGEEEEEEEVEDRDRERGSLVMLGALLPTGSGGWGRRPRMVTTESDAFRKAVRADQPTLEGHIVTFCTQKVGGWVGGWEGGVIPRPDK